MAEQVKVVVGADTSQFNAELQKAENELRQFQNALKKTTDTKELEALNKKIVETQSKITGLSTSFQKVPASTNAAANSITNLSRIVSDSAYGFIGIANNIQPFIDSLAYAKREAAATGTSLGKNLISVLTGAGGLSLAVAAVTTAITFAQIGFSAWTRGTKDAKEKTDELKKAQDELQKSIDNAKASAYSSGISLQNFVNIAKDSTLPLSQRNEALKQANDILGEHGKKLTLANIATKEITDQTNLYTQALVAQAVAAKYTDEIATLTVKRIKLETQKNQLLQDSKLIISDLTVKEKTYSDNIKNGLIVSTESNSITQNDLILKGKKANNDQKVLEIQKELDQVTRSLSAANIEATRATLESTAAFGKLGYKAKEVADNFKKIKFTPAKVEKIEISSKKISDNIKKDLSQIRPLTAVPIPITFLPPKTGLIEVTDAINNFMVNAGMDIGNAFADILSQAITTGITFGDAFKGVFNALGGAITQLGQELLKVGIIAIAAKLALNQVLANPYAVVAVGIALAALGKAIQSTTAKQRFAVGTNYAPGGMALVGERGPELVNLPRGSQVIPAGRTASIMGGMASQVEVFGMLRGQDIYFSNKKYGQTYGRTT